MYGAVPPLAARPTVTGPATVAPAAGLVNDAASVIVVEPFCTVTLREADAERLWASVTVSPSVWLLLATVIVSHENDADVALVVVEKTWVPSTLRR